MVYNANGIRTSKTVNGVKHEYMIDGTKILRETWGDNVLIPLYDNEDSVCGIIYNDYAYYFLKNLQGDIIAITNNKGKIVASYTYDAWGVCTIVSDNTGIIASINPFRYRGYYYDQETGLFYLQSRYYDPSVGRFINSDTPIYLYHQNELYRLNLYTYCQNSVLVFLDETGYDANYIDDQEAKPYGSMKFGKSTIGEAGCGIVAVYNVLHYYSKKVKFHNLISQLRNTPPSINGLILVSGIISFANWLYNLDGRAGISVFSIVTFLKAKFFFVTWSVLITKLWGLRAKVCKAVIVAYGTKNGYGHYVGGINYGGRSGADFRFYNAGKSVGFNKISITTYINLLKKEKKLPLFFVGVNGKKGWW